jgi:hypothetical protein
LIPTDHEQTPNSFSQPWRIWFSCLYEIFD